MDDIDREENLLQRIDANDRVWTLVDRLQKVNSILEETGGFEELIQKNKTDIDEVTDGYPDCAVCEDSGKIRHNRRMENGKMRLGKKICFCQAVKYRIQEDKNHARS